MSNVKHVNDKTFEAEVVESEQPVLVDFWAPWCGPCRMLGPVIEELSDSYAGRVKVVKINTEESPQVAQTLGVRSIPTVALFHGNEVVDAAIGVRPKIAFEKMLDKYLKKAEKKAKKEAKRQAKEARKEAAA